MSKRASPDVLPEDGKLLPDPDYEAHIDYRWGCEGLKKTIWNLMNTAEGEDKKSSSPIVEDSKSSNAHCISYKIKDLSKVQEIHFCICLLAVVKETGFID